MKHHRQELWFQTPTRRAYLDITPDVEQALADSGIQEGLLLCNAMHISSSVFINDNERGLHHDFEAWLERLAPEKPYDQYRHNDTGEDNADAHLKRTVMGREVVVAVTSRAASLGVHAGEGAPALQHTRTARRPQGLDAPRSAIRACGRRVGRSAA